MLQKKQDVIHTWESREDVSHANKLIQKLTDRQEQFEKQVNQKLHDFANQIQKQIIIVENLIQAAKSYDITMHKHTNEVLELRKELNNLNNQTNLWQNIEQSTFGTKDTRDA